MSASIIESEPVAGTARSQETQRPWSCGPVVENQVRKIRKQYDRLEGGASQHTQMFKYGWKIRADDPTYRNEDISPLWFCERTVGMWVPELIFPRECRAPVCPQCKSNAYVDPKKAQWADGGPVRVYSAAEGCWWLDCKRYPCRSCNIRFRSTNPESISRLNQKCINAFDVYMGSRFAVDGHTAHLVDELWDPMGSKRLVDACTHMVYDQYYRSHHTYLCLIHAAGQGSWKTTEDAGGAIVSYLRPHRHEMADPQPTTSRTTSLEGLANHAMHGKNLGKATIQAWKKDGICNAEDLAQVGITRVQVGNMANTFTGAYRDRMKDTLKAYKDKAIAYLKAFICLFFQRRTWPCYFCSRAASSSCCSHSHCCFQCGKSPNIWTYGSSTAHTLSAMWTSTCSSRDVHEYAADG